MNVQKFFPVPVVEPAQVWDGLTAEAQAGAIRLMATLASNLSPSKIGVTVVYNASSNSTSLSV
jgi:hypothetical protein